MRYRSWIWGSISLITVVALLATGCGGGTAMPSGPGTPDPMPNVDFHNNTGDPNNPLDTASLGTPVVVSNENEAAPLGTDPQYGMTLIQGSQDTKVSSRATSDVAGGDPFEILNVTLTSDTVTDVNTINWHANNLNFDEGSNVKLWIKFETAGNINFTRKWSVGSPLNLSTVDSLVSPSQGIYVASLFQALPMLDGTANANATFLTEFIKLRSGASTSKTGSVVPIVDDDDPFVAARSVPFTILNYHDNPQPPQCWQMVWEKSLTSTDYDYNDLVCRLCATEILTDDNKVKQINVRVKAIARGDGYSANWQFNLNSDFPGTDVTSYTQMYQHGGVKDGPMRTWRSHHGVGIPVFTPVRNVIPSPSGPTSTVNVIAGEAFSHGGWVDVKIILDTPISLANYTPLPYTNQMRIEDTPGEVFLVNLRTGKGTAKDKLNRPLGFLTPEQWAWALEGRDIKLAYPRFDQWVAWANDPASTPAGEPTWWKDAPIFTQGSKKNAYKPSFFVGGPALPIPD